MRKTQSQRRQESEQALLDAAVAVIAQGGVSAVTFESLAEAGGFSRGLASSRFGTKARLIEAVVTALRSRQARLAGERDDDGRTGLDSVLAYVDGGLADIARRPEARAYFMLLSSSVAEASELREFFAATHEDVRAMLEEQVRRGQADGSIQPGIEPAAAGLMIGCMMFGSLMQYLVDPAGDFEALRRSTIGMLRTGLGTGEAGKV
jgi:AcrR family transcriptional regulator